LAGRLGTIAVAVGMLGGGALVAWNIWGQGPYGDSCHMSLGCRSFYCVHHAIETGGAQVPSPGRCTKGCDGDADCTEGARCVVLSEDTRDDLPPFGKPDRACLWVK
jgi:hypothetical protein